MYDILSDFMYSLNFNLSFFTDDITVSQKPLILHVFLWDSSLSSVLKEWI